MNRAVAILFAPVYVLLLVGFAPARASSSANKTEVRTILAGLVSLDQLNAFIAMPGAGTIIFFLLFAFAFLYSYALGYTELLVGLPGFGSSRDFGGGLIPHLDSSSLMTKFAILQEAWQTFDVTSDQCRKRFLCELHAVRPQLGTATRQAMQLMDYAVHVPISYVPHWLRPIIEEWVESRRMAKKVKDCSKYNSCTTSLSRRHVESDGKPLKTS